MIEFYTYPGPTSNNRKRNLRKPSFPQKKRIGYCEREQSGRQSPDNSPLLVFISHIVPLEGEMKRKDECMYYMKTIDMHDYFW